MGTTIDVEDLPRLHAPQVLGALVRRYGHFEAVEDAVHEALLAAAGQWPSAGVPDNPRGWLIKVASRRLTDVLRSEEAWRAREERAAALTSCLATGPDRRPARTTPSRCCSCAATRTSPRPPRSRSPCGRSAV